MLTLAGALTLAAAQAGAADWQRIDAPPPVTGLDGRSHAATCSGYPGTDATFRFWTRAGRSDKLVVFFEGGGACWDDLTCTYPAADGLPEGVPQFFVPQAPAEPGPKDLGGLFRADDPSNPVHDWTQVYIPYCTGDIHTGSATRTYANAGHPVYPLPSTFPIEHRGFDNFMVVLEWARQHVPAPSQVLVAGSSAGGYGATANSPWVAKAYPEARLAVLADSSQGVTTPGFDFGNPGRAGWNPQLAPWIFGAPETMPGSQMMHRAAAGLPQARLAQFTTVLDQVQVGFYGLMEQYYGPGGECPNVALDWNGQMTAQLASDRTLPNYRHFIAAGSYHTLLRDDGFY
ncbi:hypothetical protein CLD22_26965, partial [Rubrivivax gelatinosus]|nr:hypothetical protein [Rubrivivax gelatinosus]